MPLPGAAGEQQLQHLPLQEVPQHVRGAQEDREVQVRQQDRAGPEGHPVSAHVRQVLEEEDEGEEVTAAKKKMKIWR